MRVEVSYIYLYLAIIVSIVVCFCMILGLMKKIGQWGIFSKAGISEWKSLVPVYNQIQLLNMQIITLACCFILRFFNTNYWFLCRKRC